MNKTLKLILLDIARLPQKDQEWLLKQLTPTQKEQFNQYQGAQLLQQASEFARLKTPRHNPPQEPLPTLCESLRHLPPRLIAMILAQGQFPWQQRFLDSCKMQHEIETLLQQDIHLIKKETQSYVFTTWQHSLAEPMEHHG